jgi:hypothetical protein
LTEFAGDQKVLLRSVAVGLWQSDSLALSSDVYPVSQPLLNLLCASWRTLESVVFVSKLAAAICVRWAKELLEGDQSVIRCPVILDQVYVAYSNGLANVRVQVS